MTHQLNANAQPFVPYTPADPATPWDKLTPTQQAYCQRNGINREREAQILQRQAGEPDMTLEEKCQRMAQKEKNRHPCHARAYRCEKAQRKKCMEEIISGQDFRIQVKESTSPSSRSASSSSSDPGPSREPTPTRPFKFDPKVPLSVYWDDPAGRYSRAWTSVTGIGSGAEWGTGRLSRYGGIVHSEPQPITDEEGEIGVLERAYYKEE